MSPQREGALLVLLLVFSALVVFFLTARVVLWMLGL